MTQTNQDLRTRYSANDQHPVYDGQFPTGNRPYLTVTGNGAHGATAKVTAHKLSLGTKPRQAPLLWENFQAGTNGATLQTYDPGWIRYNGPQSIGARITSAEARYVGSKSAFNDSINGFSTNHKRFTPSRKLYLSYWAKASIRPRDVGTATAGLVKGISDTTKAWTNNQFSEMVLMVTSGRGLGSPAQLIASNTSNTITFAENWWSWTRISDVSSSSSTSLTVGTGAQTLTVGSNLLYKAGETIKIVDRNLSSRYMTGTVTSYVGTTLVVNVLAVSGSGTTSSWTAVTTRPQNMNVSVTGGDYWITNNDPAAEGSTPVYGSTGTINPEQVVRWRVTGSNTSAVVTISSGGITYLTQTVNVADSTTVYKLTPSGQLKLGRLTASPLSGGTTNGDGSGLSIDYNGIGTQSLSSWHFENSDTSTAAYYGLPATPVYYINTPVNAWFKIEMTVYLSDVGVANGYLKAKVIGPNGGEVEFSNVISRQTGQTNMLIDEFLIGTMFANVITNDMKAFNTDIMVQDSWSRLVVGDNPVFADCVIREDQPYTTWSASEADIIFNTASITGPKYLFFIDENQVATPGYYIGG